jgi:tetratricopeptide (TPR) repeat protein
MVQIKQAHKLDPLALTVSSAEGRILHFARRYDQAIEHFLKILELDPNFVPAHFDLGISYEQTGMFEAALTEYQTCARLSGGGLVYVAAVEAYGRLGQRDTALKMISELLEASKNQYLSPHDMSLIYTAMGDYDETLSWLEKAYEQRDGSLVWCRVAPECDPMRSDARFQNLLHRMDFPGS